MCGVGSGVWVELQPTRAERERGRKRERERERKVAASVRVDAPPVGAYIDDVASIVHAAPLGAQQISQLDSSSSSLHFMFDT